MLRLFLSLVFFCLMLPVEAQVPGFFMKEDRRKVVVPFTKVNDLVVVPVSINGADPLNFLIDTGVKSNILFSKRIGDELGLVYSRKLNLIGADGKTVLTASVSINNHFDLEKIEGALQAILVLEDDFLELEKILGVPIYGIIGYEFFKFNPVKIDYGNRKISFYRPDALGWRPFGYRAVDLNIEDNKPYVQGEIRQLEGPVLKAKLLVDTGANHSLLLNRETSEDIVLPPVTVETDLGMSLGGNLHGFMGRVGRLKLGNLNFRQVLTSYPNKTEFFHIILETGRVGSLGSELLSRMKLILDYPRERMLFKKGSYFTEPFKYDMSGISVRLVSVDEPRVYVSQVREGSPAQRVGVQKFDEITSINKVPIEFWKLSDINELFRSEVGREITLELLREEGNELKELTLTFVLLPQL